MEETFPKYQYSRFDSKEGQYVVRTNNIDEFRTMVKFVNDVVGSSPYNKVKKQVSVDEFENDHICPVHGVEMTKRESKTKIDKDGNPVKYFAHGSTVNGKFQLCFGK